MADLSLLHALFHDLRGDERIELRIKDPEKEGLSGRLMSNDFDEIDEFAEKYNGKAHVFFGIGPRKRGGGGTKEDVTRLTTVWVDVDAKDYGNNKVDAFDSASKFALPPSAVIESGHGYHFYWFLNHSETNFELIEDVIKRLHKLVGALPVFDAARLLRVPGTTNVKDMEALVPCVAMRVRDDIRYSLSDIDAAIDLPKPVVYYIHSDDVGRFKSRSERDLSIMSSLTRANISSDAASVIFHECACSEKVLETGGDKYFKRTLEKSKKARSKAKKSSFQVIENCWYYADKEISTFVFDPKRLLEAGIDSTTGGEDGIVGDVICRGGVVKDFTFPQSAFHRLATFQVALKSMDWSFTGNDTHVRGLQGFLMEQLREIGMPKARATGMIGRHDDIWVTPNEVLTKEGLIGLGDAPVVFVPTRREHPNTSLSPLLGDAEYTAFLRSIWSHLININKPDIFWPVFGWYMATPFKPLLEDAQIRFPLLNIFGGRGAGKTTTLIYVMQPLIGYKEPKTYDCGMTEFALLSLLASTYSIPVSLSEFRRDSLGEQRFAKLSQRLRLAYDTGWEVKGKQNQTTVNYRLSAPITVDGEDALLDPAAQERQIMVGLSQEYIKEGSSHWGAFNELVKFDLKQFAGRYIQHTLGMSVHDVTQLWNKAYEELNNAVDRQLPDRVRKNYTTVVFGLRAAERFIHSFAPELEFPSLDVLIPSIENVVPTGMARTQLFVDTFVEDVINQAMLRPNDIQFNFKWSKTDGIFWFHLGGAMGWWYRYRRSQGLGVLEKLSIKQQLNERKSISGLAEPGQYMIGRRNHRGPAGVTEMYGIDVIAAQRSGLDVPNDMDMSQVTIALRKRLEEE